MLIPDEQQARCQRPETHFWRQIRSNMLHIFNFLQSEMVFGIAIPFRECLIPSPGRTLSDFNVFLFDSLRARSPSSHPREWRREKRSGGKESRPRVLCAPT